MAEVNVDARTGPCFSLGNRMRRLLWKISWLAFCRFSPRPLHGWRSFWLRRFGAKVGRGVHVYPSVRIWAPWNLVLKDQAGIGDGVTLYSIAIVEIGRRAVVSQGCHLCTGTHDYNDAGFPLVARPIKVGDEAWIAAEAFVHPGVTVGAGTVVGARSVVTGDLPDWMVCAGHPCKPIKERLRQDPDR